jgi:xanthine dehydrogenase/oxidase
MTIYALFGNAACRGHLTVDDVELNGAHDWNLCRCTGYKPILHEAKTIVGEYMNGNVEFNVSCI